MKLKSSIFTNITIIACFFLVFSLNSYSKAVSVTAGKTYQIVEVKEGVDGKMTEFFFNDDNSEKHSILELTKGKVAFLNFWGTWCPPCRAEIPDIIKLQKELGSKLVVYGVALERNTDEAMKKVTEFAKTNNINYVNFVGSKEMVGKLTNSYNGVSAVPTTYVVDKSNNVFEKIVGSRTKDDFEATVSKLIK
jgi:thiol-disulfide isomerase/thioredoxin